MSLPTNKTKLDNVNSAVKNREEKLMEARSPLDVYSLMAQGRSAEQTPNLLGLPSPPIGRVQTSDELLKSTPSVRYVTHVEKYNMSEEIDRAEYRKLSERWWNEQDKFAQVDTNTSWDKFGNYHIFVEYVEVVPIEQK
jgi:hypothetical protein